MSKCDYIGCDNEVTDLSGGGWGVCDVHLQAFALFRKVAIILRDQSVVEDWVQKHSKELAKWAEIEEDTK